MTVSAATPARREWYQAPVSLVARHSSLVWLIMLTITTLTVYASSLSYPFFWVDPIDIGLARDRSVLQIITTSQGYLYYRPLAFVLWKLLAALQGEFNPFAFHLVHIVTHLVNVWLMFALAKRVLKQTFAAGIAALFFAWYPFSHQTITWVISPQPQATLFMLLSAILYYDGRVKHRESRLQPELNNVQLNRLKTRLQAIDKRIWLSVLMLVLALPFQENAVSFGFVIAALELLVIPHPPARSPLLKTAFSFSGEGSGVRWYPLLHIAVCLAFAALWFIIPKDPDSTVARFDQATGWYLLQGLIWPIAGSIGPWRVWFAALSNPAWTPLIIAAPITLALLFIAYWRGRKLRLFFFGLIWFVVMILPIWATRGFGYVGTSPRILYVAAGGAALIWAGLLTLDFRSARVTRWWRVCCGLLIVFTLLQSALFLNVRKSLHDQTMPAIWDVVDAGQAAGNNAKLLFINTPDQITPKWREFPVGFFRAVLMPVSVDLGQYVELQKGARPQTQSLTVPSLAHLEDYPYNVDMRGEAVDQATLSAAIRDADRAFIAEYDPSGAVKIVEAGGLTAQQSAQSIATFDGRLQLAEATLDSDHQRLTLIWNCLAPLSADETIFVHVFDAQGQLVTQADGAPLRELFPLSECQPGEQIRDVRHLAIDASRPYAIKAGLYNRATGQRLQALDDQGQSITDNAVSIRQSGK
jgi:hypothetical protein